jgi:putative transposase
MITILSTLVSLLSFRVRSRASLELELIALRHQVIFLRRQRPRRLRLFFTDRLFWVWLYRNNTVFTVVYGMVGFWVSAR